MAILTDCARCPELATHIAASLGYDHSVGRPSVGVVLLCQTHVATADEYLPERLDYDVTAAMEGWPDRLTRALDSHWPRPVPLDTLTAMA